MPLNSLAKKTLNLPRLAKRVIALFLDSCLCILAVWAAFYLRLGSWLPLSGVPVVAIAASLGLALPVFIYFGLYRAIFRYSGWPALITVAKAAIIYGVAYCTLFTAIGFEGIPRTVGIIQPLLLFIAVGALRAFARFWLGGSMGNKRLERSGLPRVLIYGAGSAGRQLAAAMRSSNQFQVLGYLDDDENLHGGVLNGLTIFRAEDLHGLVNSLGITDVLLALPSVTRARRNEILQFISESKVAVRTLPDLSDLARGKVTASDLRELDVEDLLGRDSVKPDLKLIRKNIFNEVVMVTGAGGSIGSELCRQILKQDPKSLILFEQSEFALYSIHQELIKKLDLIDSDSVPHEINIIPILGSVRDAELVGEILKEKSPHIIFHAAAYKHVPLVEENYIEGISNNVFGTKVMAAAAMQHKIPNFVLISTDKAVRPTNIMGASKRLAELVLQAYAKSSLSADTLFSMVRFGNVLDSSGSVVPLFRKQIKDGGPITLTHADVTRYFMTIPEAAQLVIQAGAMAQGGDVFVLNMGEPVRILDLAKHMIELSGLEVLSVDNPEGDIEIEITGLRPGEKLYEELLIGENPELTDHQLIMKAHEPFFPLDVLEDKLLILQKALYVKSPLEIKVLLQDLVEGYDPATNG
jgi:FlaA1/EpsC-like NDP-sugar epimerase